MKTVVYTHNKNFSTSAVLTDAWYNSKTQELYVRFRRSGSFAGYAGVPFDVYSELVYADSAGAYYNAELRESTLYSGINTENIDDESFVPYQEPDEVVIPKAGFVSTLWGRSHHDHVHTAGILPKPVEQKSKYRVTGRVLVEATRDGVFEADSLAEAEKAFRAVYGDKTVEVTGVNKV